MSWCLFAVGHPVGPSTGVDGTSTQPYVAMNGVNGIQSDKDSYETIQSPTDHYVYKGRVLARSSYIVCLFCHSSTLFLVLLSLPLFPVFPFMHLVSCSFSTLVSCFPIHAPCFLFFLYPCFLFSHPCTLFLVLLLLPLFPVFPFMHLVSCSFSTLVSCFPIQAPCFLFFFCYPCFLFSHSCTLFLVLSLPLFPVFPSMHLVSCSSFATLVSCFPIHAPCFLFFFCYPCFLFSHSCTLFLVLSLPLFPVFPFKHLVSCSSFATLVSCFPIHAPCFLFFFRYPCFLFSHSCTLFLVLSLPLFPVFPFKHLVSCSFSTLVSCFPIHAPCFLFFFCYPCFLFSHPCTLFLVLLLLPLFPVFPFMHLVSCSSFATPVSCFPIHAPCFLFFFCYPCFLFSHPCTLFLVLLLLPLFPVFPSMHLVSCSFSTLVSCFPIHAPCFLFFLYPCFLFSHPCTLFLVLLSLPLFPVFPFMHLVSCSFSTLVSCFPIHAPCFLFFLYPCFLFSHPCTLFLVLLLLPLFPVFPFMHLVSCSFSTLVSCFPIQAPCFLFFFCYPCFLFSHSCTLFLVLSLPLFPVFPSMHLVSCSSFATLVSCFPIHAPCFLFFFCYPCFLFSHSCTLFLVLSLPLFPVFPFMHLVSCSFSTLVSCFPIHAPCFLFFFCYPCFLFSHSCTLFLVLSLPLFPVFPFMHLVSCSFSTLVSCFPIQAPCFLFFFCYPCFLFSHPCTLFLVLLLLPLFPVFPFMHLVSCSFSTLVSCFPIHAPCFLFFLYPCFLFSHPCTLFLVLLLLPLFPVFPFMHLVSCSFSTLVSCFPIHAPCFLFFLYPCFLFSHSSTLFLVLLLLPLFPVFPFMHLVSCSFSTLVSCFPIHAHCFLFFLYPCFLFSHSSTLFLVLLLLPLFPVFPFMHLVSCSFSTLVSCFPIHAPCFLFFLYPCFLFSHPCTLFLVLLLLPLFPVFPFMHLVSCSFSTLVSCFPIHAPCFLFFLYPCFLFSHSSTLFLVLLLLPLFPVFLFMHLVSCSFSTLVSCFPIHAPCFLFFLYPCFLFSHSCTLFLVLSLPLFPVFPSMHLVSCSSFATLVSCFPIHAPCFLFFLYPCFLFSHSCTLFLVLSLPLFPVFPSMHLVSCSSFATLVSCFPIHAPCFLFFLYPCFLFSHSCTLFLVLSLPLFPVFPFKHLVSCSFSTLVSCFPIHAHCFLFFLYPCFLFSHPCTLFLVLLLLPLFPVFPFMHLVSCSFSTLVSCFPIHAPCFLFFLYPCFLFSHPCTLFLVLLLLPLFPVFPFMHLVSCSFSTLVSCFPIHAPCFLFFLYPCFLFSHSSTLFLVLLLLPLFPVFPFMHLVSCSFSTLVSCFPIHAPCFLFFLYPCFLFSHSCTLFLVLSLPLFPVFPSMHLVSCSSFATLVSCFPIHTPCFLFFLYPCFLFSHSCTLFLVLSLPLFPVFPSMHLVSCSSFATLVSCFPIHAPCFLFFLYPCFLFSHSCTLFLVLSLPLFPVFPFKHLVSCSSFATLVSCFPIHAPCFLFFLYPCFLFSHPCTLFLVLSLPLFPVFPSMHLVSCSSFATLVSCFPIHAPCFLFFFCYPCFLFSHSCTLFLVLSLPLFPVFPFKHLVSCSSFATLVSCFPIHAPCFLFFFRYPCFLFSHSCTLFLVLSLPLFPVFPFKHLVSCSFSTLVSCFPIHAPCFLFFFCYPCFLFSHPCTLFLVLLLLPLFPVFPFMHLVSCSSFATPVSCFPIHAPCFLFFFCYPCFLFSHPCTLFLVLLLLPLFPVFPSMHLVSCSFSTLVSCFSIHAPCFLFFLYPCFLFSHSCTLFLVLSLPLFPVFPSMHLVSCSSFATLVSCFPIHAPCFLFFFCYPCFLFSHSCTLFLVLSLPLFPVFPFMHLVSCSFSTLVSCFPIHAPCFLFFFRYPCFLFSHSSTLFPVLLLLPLFPVFPSMHLVSCSFATLVSCFPIHAPCFLFSHSSTLFPVLLSLPLFPVFPSMHLVSCFPIQAPCFLFFFHYPCFLFSHPCTLFLVLSLPLFPVFPSMHHVSCFPIHAPCFLFSHSSTLFPVLPSMWRFGFLSKWIMSWATNVQELRTPGKD